MHWGDALWVLRRGVCRAEEAERGDEVCQREDYWGKGVEWIGWVGRKEGRKAMNDFGHGNMNSI